MHACGLPARVHYICKELLKVKIRPMRNFKTFRTQKKKSRVI